MKPMKNACSKIIPSRTPWLSGSCCGGGRFRPLLAEPTENTIIQLFRYVITGASSFLVDFLLLFLLELAGLYYLPASAVSFLVGISCNFLLTKFFAFKSVDPTVGPTAEVFVFAAISGGGLVLTMVLMYLFTSRLQLYFMVSKLISSILVFFLEFPGSEVHSLPRKGPRTCLTPSNKERDLPWEIPFFVALKLLRPTPALPRSRIAFPVVPWHSRKAALPGGKLPQVELHRGVWIEHRLHSRVSGAAARLPGEEPGNGQAAGISIGTQIMDKGPVRPRLTATARSTWTRLVSPVRR